MPATGGSNERFEVYRSCWRTRGSPGGWGGGLWRARRRVRRTHLRWILGAGVGPVLDLRFRRQQPSERWFGNLRTNALGCLVIWRRGLLCFDTEQHLDDTSTDLGGNRRSGDQHRRSTYEFPARQSLQAPWFGTDVCELGGTLVGVVLRHGRQPRYKGHGCGQPGRGGKTVGYRRCAVKFRRHVANINLIGRA